MNTEKIINKHVLFVVENNSVPFDTRVWNEAKSIRTICNNVSVICPRPRNEKSYFKIISDIKVYMYPNLIQGASAYGLIGEYLLAYFFISLYSIFIFIKNPFDIVHLANPPDFLSLIYFPYKLLNIKIIFDNHDLSPETYIVKFGRKDLFYRLLILLERITYKISDYIIVVNESCKSIVVKRNKIHKKMIIVVRNGPNLEIVNQALRGKKNKIKKHLVCYVGIIDKQDDLKQLVFSIEHIVYDKKYFDFKMLIIGDGTDKENIETLVKEKGLSDYFIFHGAEFDRTKFYQLLSDTSICVDPQRCNKDTKIATAIKIMEYMAVSKPIIQYNTEEGRYSAGDSSVYIANNDAIEFGDAIIELLKNKKKRNRMGKIGQMRIKEKLQWAVQEKKLINLYKNILS